MSASDIETTFLRLFGPTSSSWADDDDEFDDESWDSEDNSEKSVEQQRPAPQWSGYLYAALEKHRSWAPVLDQRVEQEEPMVVKEEEPIAESSTVIFSADDNICAGRIYNEPPPNKDILVADCLLFLIGVANLGLMWWIG